MAQNGLIYLTPIVHFYILGNILETSAFLRSSGDLEVEHWPRLSIITPFEFSHTFLVVMYF